MPPLPALPKWDRIFSGRLGLGYRDNVLRASSAPQGSAFLLTSGEFFVSRLPLDGTQVDVMVTGELYGYFHKQTVSSEASAFGLAAIRKDWNVNWQTSLSLEALYQDQVLDVSTTDPAIGRIKVQGETLIARPGLRRNLLRSSWVAVEFSAARQFYLTPLDDYWEGGPKLILGHAGANKSEVTLSYEALPRSYDTDAQLAADGTPLPGTRRRFLQQDSRLTWRHHWDSARHWRTTTKLGFKRNDDIGSGYFNYERAQVSEQLRFRNERWEITGAAKANFYHFPVQTVTTTDLRRREQSELTINLRAERRFGESVKLFLEFDREQTLSNVASDRYTVNTASGGLHFEF
ncbi:MAG TPA: hypothetical protein VGK40_03610 [Verrucomicrobiae bacterium]